MIFNMVLLPQPDGPTNTPTSPAPSPNLRSTSTSCRSPAAFVNALRAISTSSCTGAPPRYSGFKGLHQDGFDREHHRHETERIGEQTRNVEQLEGNADLETDAIWASEQFGYQDDLPDQGETGPRGGRDVGRQLRQYDMPERPPTWDRKHSGHFVKRRVECTGSLAHGDDSGG